MTDGAIPPLSVSAVASGIWRISLPHRADLVHCYVLTGPPVTLVDGGSHLTYHLLEEGLRSVGVEPDRVELVLLTHAHPDHMGGASMLAQHHRPLLMGSDSVAAMARQYADVVAGWAALPQALVARYPDLLPLLDASLTRYAEASHSVPTLNVEGFPDAGATLHIGSQTVIAIASPGHAKGHVSFHFPERGILFSGDVLLSVGPAILGHTGGSPGDYSDTIERLAVIGAERVLGGHGVEVPPEVAVEASRGLVSGYRDRVLRAVGKEPTRLRELIRRFWRRDPHPDGLPVAFGVLLTYLEWMHQSGQIELGWDGEHTVIRPASDEGQ